ncbi:MAG: hypothetical protein HY688_02970, partial [Chloroflexi bacterium]|nr:hypothetical protein [Chloroflexota bacterium]
MIPATPEAFSHLPLGQPVRTEGQAWGLSYPGEVVRIERWTSQWSRDLPSDLSFRLVLLTAPARAPSPASLTDDRIAVLLPTPAATRLRERRRAYAGGILGQVAGITAVVGRTAEALSSTSLSGPDALRAFADAFVQALYPAPPVDLAGAAEPLGPAQARLVWEGIASPTPRAEARAAALHYGPRLGLAEGGTGPGPVARLIAEAARAAAPAGLPLADLRLRLLREASLPPHLTTLYLLVATLRAEPPLALALAPGARIPLSGG